MSSLQNWYEKEFLPWKQKAVEEHKVKAQQVEKILHHASEIKYVVALLLEKRENEAVKQWNNLGLEPALSELTLNIEKNTLTLTPQNGEAMELVLDTVLKELQELIS